MKLRVKFSSYRFMITNRNFFIIESFDGLSATIIIVITNNCLELFTLGCSCCHSVEFFFVAANSYGRPWVFQFECQLIHCVRGVDSNLSKRFKINLEIMITMERNVTIIKQRYPSSTSHNTCHLTHDPFWRIETIHCNLQCSNSARQTLNHILYPPRRVVAIRVWWMP